MAQSFAEACRVLKPGQPFVVVYAHKTTAGWATLIDALRHARFMITEAWPLDTEMGARLRAQDSAALASSIFIVARRREGDSVGDSEAVRPQLQQIVRERVATLLKEKVTGADLVIAAVGAGLRAYTQYARIEQPNGADFPTGDYLEFVQREVLRVVLDKVFEEVPDATPGAIQQIDQATRFYVLARYQYIASSIPFDEINTLLHAVSNRLEIADLAQGLQPLLKSGKLVQLYDYRQRGSDPELGLDGNAERIDILHRLLWLNDNEPGNIAAYSKQIGDEQLASVQLVAEALQGKTLEANSRTPEQHAAGKLLSGWKQIVRERGSYDPTARHLDYEADPDQPYTTDMFGGRPKRK